MHRQVKRSQYTEEASQLTITMASSLHSVWGYPMVSSCIFNSVHIVLAWFFDVIQVSWILPTSIMIIRRWLAPSLLPCFWNLWNPYGWDRGSQVGRKKKSGAPFMGCSWAGHWSMATTTQPPSNFSPLVKRFASKQSAWSQHLRSWSFMVFCSAQHELCQSIDVCLSCGLQWPENRARWHQWTRLWL